MEMLSRPDGVSLLAEYAKEHPLCKQAELELFKLGDEALLDKYIRKWSIYEDTFEQIKKDHRFDLIESYFNWRYRISRDKLDDNLLKAILKKEPLTDEMFSYLLCFENGKEFAQFYSQYAQEWSSVAMSECEKLKLYFDKKIEEYQQKEFLPQIRRDWLLKALDFSDGEKITEEYLSCFKFLYHGGFDPDYSSSMVKSDVWPFWSKLCDILIKKGLKEDVLKQCLKSQKVGFDKQECELREAWQKGKHLFDQKTLVDEICQRPYSKDAAVSFLKTLGFSYAMLIEIMQQPWGEEIIKMYIQKGYTLHFDSLYDDDSPQRESALIMQAEKEQEVFMHFFKQMPRASELMKAYVKVAPQCLPETVVISCADMKDAKQIFTTCIDRWPDRAYYVIRQSAEWSSDVCSDLMKLWFRRIREKDRHLYNYEVEMLLKTKEADEWIEMAFDEGVIRFNDVYLWQIERYPNIVSRWLEKTRNICAVLIYLKQHPDLDKTAPDLAEVLHDSIEEILQDETCNLVNLFRGSEEALCTILTIRGYRELFLKKTKGHALSSIVLFHICETQDTEDVLLECLKNAKYSSYSVALAKKMDEKGFNKALELYLSQI